MNLRIRFFMLIAVGLLVVRCTSLQSTPASAPTLIHVDDLIRILDDQEASTRQLVSALFELERIDPAPVTAIPSLLQLLKHDDSWVRVRAINALAYMENAANCAVPQIADHLWDSVGFVRTGAATALDHITHMELVDSYAKFEPGENGFSYDEPDGRISGKAREWWNSEGQFRNWSAGENYCEIQP